MVTLRSPVSAAIINLPTRYRQLISEHFIILRRRFIGKITIGPIGILSRPPIRASMHLHIDKTVGPL